MKTIQPINASQEELVINRSHYYIDLAKQIFNQNFPFIPISFKLTGRAAGMYHVKNQQRFIRYNPYLFAKFFEDNLATTVPHEIAHYVADQLYGIKNIRPHGKEWKSIMQRFGVEANIHCQYDLQGIPQRKLKRFTYHCQCQEYEVTSRRHNMILRGQRLYYCPACKTRLQPLNRI
ncbi:MAG: SprT-like domain-containing protein [Gammaproteobacteria bacterium]|nr:SprT-like domain-containing protein [Gammaproteobacteria bacterium]